MLLLYPNNYYGSDNEEESLLANEGDSFADEDSEGGFGPGSEDVEVQQSADDASESKSSSGIGSGGYKRARALAERRLPKMLGQSLTGNKRAFFDDSEQNKERLKEEAKRRARRYAQDKVGQKVESEAFKKGFGAGMKSAKRADAAAKAAKGAREAGSAARKAQQAARAAKLGKTGLQAAVTGAGVATGSATFGLGFIASIILNIAISLGISEAIDAVFALKAGKKGEALFHAIKAIALVVGFLVFLILALLLVTPVGIMIFFPFWILFNIYVILGVIFPKTAWLQGFSRKWEIAILIIIDVYMIIFAGVFIAGVAVGICNVAFMGEWVSSSGGVFNYVAGKMIQFFGQPAISFMAWIAGDGGAINELCKAVNQHLQ